MGKDITKFVSKKSKQENLIDRFHELVKSAKTKEEIREIEMALLKPKPLPSYKAGGKGLFTGFKKRSIRLTFNNGHIIKKWMNMFRVNTYLEFNTYEVDFITELFHLLETNRLTWDKKKKKYYLHTKDGRRLRL